MNVGGSDGAKSGVFVVSGSGSGIGRAIATKLVQENRLVVGIGRDAMKLERLQSELGADKFSFVSADLSLSEGVKAAVSGVRSHITRLRLPLHGLVNNAGVYDRQDFLTTTDEVWERQFHNNLLSAVRLTRELHVELKAAAPSSVLNISSSLAQRPVANTSAYTAMKAAMNSWTQVLALEWARENIRANCICPGLVDTPIHGFHGKPETDPTRVQAHSFQPLARMGSAEEIAEAAWFLLSPKSAWTTGSILTVDGGISL
jgi:NAD(P)-dependent dehydrogenase (short-subunit alcohol dehydrogenase family)